MKANFLIGRWPSPWASDPFLPIRVAIEIRTRAMIVLHQRVRRRWIGFNESEDAYVRELIEDMLDEIFDDPEGEGFSWSHVIPEEWLSVTAVASPGDVDEEDPDACYRPPIDPFDQRPRKQRRRKRAARRKHNAQVAAQNQTGAGKR